MSNSLNGVRPAFTKTVSALTSIATLLTLSGTAYLAPLAASAAVPSDYGLTEGNTISASGTNDPDVYIVNELGYKRLFLNPVIFSFYGHLGGFASVKSVTAAARDAFPTSGLFRLDGDTKVYGVESTGEDTAVLHWVNTTGAQAVADDPNFFKKVFVINQNEFNWYTKGSDYTSVNQIPVYSRVPGATPVPSGAVSASLSSDNPASSTLVQGQASADLLHVQFTGSGTVTKVVLKRLGVSADATLTNVYLYDGAKRLTDSATVSAGTVTFNDSLGLFTVNGSKVISVKSDILSTASGETVGVQMTSYTSAGVESSTLLTGNLFNIASATLATVTLAADASISPTTNTALDPGSDVVVWQDTATIGTRAVSLRSVQFRVIGSVNVGDLQNFRLYVDGVQKGSAQAQTDANGYVIFDLTGAPVNLETGGRVLKVLADVVGGSSKNFTVSIRQAPDISTVDSQYNAGVLATQTGSFPAEAGQQTITQGTLTITKTTDSPAGDVVKDASGVTLARFEFKANGERVKVENLRVSNTSAPNLALRNGALFADGVQIGSTATIWNDVAATASSSTAYTEFSLGSSLIVTPGTTRIVEIRADIYDASGTNNTTVEQTITANLAAGSSNVQRLVSLNYFSSSAVAGNAVTVKTGSFSGTKYTGYANQSVVTPKQQFKLGHFNLTAASSENINVNTIVVDFDGSNDGAIASKTNNVYIVVKNDAGSSIYTSPVKSTVSSTASSSFSVNFTIPVNKTYQVEVWGNLDTVSLSTATKTFITHLLASGITANSSTTATTTVAVGQTITASSGALNVTTASYPAAALRAGGTTATTYAFGLQPQFDDFTLNEVYVDIASGSLGVGMASSTGAVATLYLRDGSNTLGSAVINGTTGSASFTGLNYPLTQLGGTKTLTVDVLFSNVGIGGNDTDANVTMRLDGLKYRSSGGTITTTNGRAPSTNTGNPNMVVKAYPTVSNVSLPSSVLTSGAENTLAKVSIGSVGGTVGLYRIVWTVNVAAGGPMIASASNFQLYENGTNVTTSLGSFSTASYNFNKTTGGVGQVAYTFTAERPVATSGTTYELRATVTGTLTAGQTISTKIANPMSTLVLGAVSDNATDVAGTLGASSASLVWTDQSAVSHSLITNDWMNDYLVQTLNVSQALTK